MGVLGPFPSNLDVLVINQTKLSFVWKTTCVNRISIKFQNFCHFSDFECFLHKSVFGPFWPNLDVLVKRNGRNPQFWERKFHFRNQDEISNDSAIFHILNIFRKKKELRGETPYLPLQRLRMSTQKKKHK